MNTITTASVPTPLPGSAVETHTAVISGALPALPGLVQSRAERKAIRLAWKAHVAHMATHTEGDHKGPSARDLAVYCLLLGIPLKLAFTPITNTVKLANGQRAHAGLESVLYNLDVRARGLWLHQLLDALNVRRVDEPGKRLGRAAYELPAYHFPVQEKLLQAAKEELAAMNSTRR